jgi:predicted transport protein
MPDLDEAVRTQIRNIETNSGRSMDDWVELVRSSGRTRHGEIMAWLKSEHGLTHGNANLIALTALRGPAAPEGDDLVNAIYSGPKGSLRPLHDRVVEIARGFGADVQLAPKQTYVALRRTKQFGTVGPASGGRLEIGLNLKGVEPAERLEASGGMCTHRVRFSDPAELDPEVMGWLRQAYDRA